MNTPLLVFIAGGNNKNFAPLAPNKTLFPFCGKPLIQYNLEMAKRVGLTDILIVTSDINHEWLSYFKLEGLNIQTKKQTQPQGMADALLTIEQEIGDRSIIVKSAADLVDDNLLRLILEKAQSAYAVVPGIELTEPFPGGYLKIDGERATGIVEKPKPGEEPSNLLILTAHYFSKPVAFFSLLKQTEQDADDTYEQALNKLMEQQSVSFIRYTGNWKKLKYSYHVLDVMQLILETTIKSYTSPTAQVSPKASITGEVYIDEGAVIHDFAAIVGPSYIGKNSKIGQHSLIRNSMVEHDVTIGFSSEISRSYVGTGCKLHHNYLNDSVLEENVNPSYGTSTANLRIDGQPVSMKLPDKKIPTSRRKLGAIIAKNVFCGINTTFMPGVTIGANSNIYPGSVVYDALPANSILKIRQEQEVVTKS